MEYMKIGRILNTRGIKGELKIKSFTDFQDDRYKKGNKIYIYFQDEYLEFEVKKHYKFKSLDLLLLKDYEDINLVEKYKGFDIYVDSNSQTTLFEDEYHLSEILGLKVYQNNKELGKVVDVKTYPQGDYLDILTNLNKHSLIPFRDEFVINVNIEKKFIEIVEMEGLI